MSYTTSLADATSLSTQAIQRIDPSVQHQPAATSVNQAKAEHLAVPRADNATLSPASLLLSKALSLSDVRTDKVASLRESIAAGTYKTPTAAVADKLAQTLQG